MQAIEPNEALVRALLRDQHPDLAGRALTAVPGGWDNAMWRLGDDLAVRMPRTGRAPSLLRAEQRWLPLLAPHLPLPVPTPVRVGEPSPRFPFTWSVVQWVHGEPADQSPVTGAAAARTLARFLGALHRPAPADAPRNAAHGGPLRLLDLDAWRPAGRDDRAVERLRRVWERALAAPEWGGPALWVHGDLHPANALVADGNLCGVVDFGDMCAGDPATDLAAAWVLLPDGASDAFLDAYAGEHGLTEATVRRAQGWAAIRALVLLEVGRKWELGLPGGKRRGGRPVMRQSAACSRPSTQRGQRRRARTHFLRVRLVASKPA